MVESGFDRAISRPASRRPKSGRADTPIPRTLMDNFGHADCGIYAEVIAGGDVVVGDVIIS